MSAAERETPAGEARREAVAQWFLCRFPISLWQARGMADALLSTGPIASELARLTERAEKAEAAVLAAFTASWPQDVIDLRAAEATLTTLRADHAAEVARKDAEIADLRGALEDTKAAADDLAQVCLDEHDNKAAGALQFISGFISDRFAALATTEMGCLVPASATSPEEA